MRGRRQGGEGGGRVGAAGGGGGSGAAGGDLLEVGAVVAGVPDGVGGGVADEAFGVAVLSGQAGVHVVAPAWQLRLPLGAVGLLSGGTPSRPDNLHRQGQGRAENTEYGVYGEEDRVHGRDPFPGPPRV